LPPGCGPYQRERAQASVRGGTLFALGGEADPRTICGSQYHHYMYMMLARRARDDHHA
jgi:hypothetical protein